MERCGGKVYQHGAGCGARWVSTVRVTEQRRSAAALAMRASVAASTLAVRLVGQQETAPFTLRISAAVPFAHLSEIQEN
jgi:hypothetical protein